jgi:hypothetical protein
LQIRDYSPLRPFTSVPIFTVPRMNIIPGFDTSRRVATSMDGSPISSPPYVFRLYVISSWHIRSQYSIALIDTLFQRPIFSSNDFSGKSAIPSESVKRILQKLREEGVKELIREGKDRRSSLFQFTRLVQIAESEGVSTRDLT